MAFTTGPSLHYSAFSSNYVTARELTSGTTEDISYFAIPWHGSLWAVDAAALMSTHLTWRATRASEIAQAHSD